MAQENKQYDVLIFGSGPAGLTAALYATRGQLDTLVIGGQPPGGQLMWTTDVENYPGFPEGILGPDLINKMREQAKNFDAQFEDENVVKVNIKGDHDFEAVTDQDNTYRGRTIIVATGASAKWLDIPGEEKYKGKGVSACATCDGFFFKDKDVVVVGGGDSAMEEATFLTRFANKVYVLVRKGKDDLKASKIMQRRAFNNDKIEFMFHTEATEIVGDDAQVNGVKIINNQTKEESKLDVQGYFVAIGHKPNTDFLEEVIELGDKGYVDLKNETHSSQHGIFVSGDVADFRYRQAVTAAGAGCKAAMDVIKHLEELEDQQTD